MQFIAALFFGSIAVFELLQTQVLSTDRTKKLCAKCLAKPEALV